MEQKIAPQIQNCIWVNSEGKTLLVVNDLCILNDSFYRIVADRHDSLYLKKRFEIDFINPNRVLQRRVIHDYHTIFFPIRTANEKSIFISGTEYYFVDSVPLLKEYSHEQQKINFELVGSKVAYTKLFINSDTLDKFSFSMFENKPYYVSHQLLEKEYLQVIYSVLRTMNSSDLLACPRMDWADMPRAKLTIEENDRNRLSSEFTLCKHGVSPKMNILMSLLLNADQFGEKTVSVSK
ncbi:MAG: hypothetical protein KBG24_00230 [Bacteroidia bacterium]|nr:hypothetical protein [Bacteroidia bacterium]MBP9178898.1 hypothetical protein [Bacteroidia bacterium]MBP9723199.1 hypothetical protein [Bacteroidia bacterium]